MESILSSGQSLWQVLSCPLHPEPGLLRPIDSDRTSRQGHARGEGLRCHKCGRHFPIVHGIIDMVVDGASDESFRAQEMKQWDEQAARYDERRRNDLIYQAGVDAAVQALQPNDGDLILDAGCGTGLTVKRYYGPAMRVVAVDLSLESLLYLRKTVNNPAILYVKADVAALPFVPDAFDKVLCANTITQLPHPDLRQACLEELTRVVRPLGRVVVSAHNLSIRKRRAGLAKEGSAITYSDPVQYIYRYDADELRQAMALSLQVESIRGAGLPLPYRFKLSPLSRYLEGKLRRWPASARWGNMLIGVGRKLHADTLSSGRPSGMDITRTPLPGDGVARGQPGGPDEHAALLPQAWEAR